MSGVVADMRVSNTDINASFQMHHQHTGQMEMSSAQQCDNCVSDCCAGSICSMSTCGSCTAGILEHIDPQLNNFLAEAATRETFQVLSNPGSSLFRPPRA